MHNLLKTLIFILVSILVITAIGKDSALAIPITIDAIDDAGQIPGQDAYVKFAYPSGQLLVTTGMVPNRWTSSSEVKSYADSKGITDWQLEAAGNIWSSDFLVGDALTNLPGGIYRVSVMDGAFMYDSFNWSPYSGQWRWQLQIQSSARALGYVLGDPNPFLDAASALSNSLGNSIDIPVNEGGSLTFWIWDTNSIDNSGSLSFDVARTVVPEPSTLILTGSGLFFLARRLRRSF